MALKLTVETANSSINTFEFILDQSPVTIGRSATCHIQLPFPTISSHHLTIVREGLGFLVADMGSTNGTRLGATVLSPDHYTSLNDGAAIVLEDLTLHVSITKNNEGVPSAERTGELMRQMVFEMARHSGEISDTAAYLEVLEGPDKGQKRHLSSSGEELVFGVGEGLADNDWRLSDTSLDPPIMKVRCAQDDFTLDLHSQGPVGLLINGARASEGTNVLTSGARLHSGETTLLFFDPLKDYLEELESKAKVAQQSRPLRIDNISSTFELKGRLEPDSLPQPSDTHIEVAGLRQRGRGTTKKVNRFDSEDKLPKQKLEGWNLTERLLLIFAIILFGGALVIFLFALGIL